MFPAAFSFPVSLSFSVFKHLWQQWLWVSVALWLPMGLLSDSNQELPQGHSQLWQLLLSLPG